MTEHFVDRILQLCDRWKPILQPVCHHLGERNLEMALQDIAGRVTEDDDVIHFGGYLASMHRWPNSEILAEFIVRFKNTLSPHQQKLFTDAIVHPLVSWITCHLHQAQLLYRLFSKGFFVLDDYKDEIYDGKVYWFGEELGEGPGRQPPANLDEYRNRRDNYRGFTRVMDAIIHDDDEEIQRIILHEKYDPVNAKFPDPDNDTTKTDEFGELRIKDFEDWYPVGFGYNESQIASFLEFACRHGAVKCFNALVQRGAKIVPGCLWTALQGGDSSIITRVNQEIRGATTADNSAMKPGEQRNCYQWAIRCWRNSEFEFCLNAFGSGWDYDLYRWILDSSYMCNNLDVLMVAYTKMPRQNKPIRSLGTRWYWLAFPLFYGNLQLLDLLPKIGDKEHQDTWSHDERDNYLKWAMRSGRVEVVHWLVMNYRTEAEELMNLWVRTEKDEERESMKRWLRARPDFVEELTGLYDKLPDFIQQPPRELEEWEKLPIPEPEEGAQ